MFTKKNTRQLLAALATVVAGAFCSSSALAGATLSPGQLKVGMEISYPPFESYVNGKPVGSDVEFAQALAKHMGASASFIDTHFTNLILGLNASHYDMVISGIYITPERTAQAPAIPYARTGASIMALASSGKQPKTERDLCGLRIGLEQGTAWVKQLASLSSSYCVPNGKGAITLREFPSAPEAMQALLSNSVQAQLEIAGAARAMSEKSSGRVVVTSTQLLYPQTLGIYYKKDNAALRKALDQAFAQMKKNGEYSAFLKKYNLAP